MHLSQGAFWLFLAVVAVAAIACWAFKSFRGEMVGSLECACRSPLGGGRTRLAVARAAADDAPTVLIRMRMPGSFVVHRLRAADARHLATLLESAAARMSGP